MKAKYMKQMLFLVFLLAFVNIVMLINIQARDDELRSLKYVIALDARRMEIVNDTVASQNRIIDALLNMYADKECFDFQDAFENVSESHVWSEDYNCVNFSEELKTKLTSLGYQASIVRGDVPEVCRNETCYTYHQFIAMYVEPQTGQFVRTSDGYVPDGMVR